MARVTPEGWEPMDRTEVPRQPSKSVDELSPAHKLELNRLEERQRIGEETLAAKREAALADKKRRAAMASAVRNHPDMPPQQAQAYQEAQRRALARAGIKEEEELDIEIDEEEDDRPIRRKGPPHPSLFKEHKSELTETDEDLPVNILEDIPPGYQRIPLPSNFITYPFKVLGIKPINVEQMIDINTACATEDPIALHDILNDTLTVDIRDLVFFDYLYVLAFHRLNSYTDFPFEFKSESIYGNMIEHKLTSTMVLKNLKMTEEEYAECLEHGIHIPTVRDSEMSFNHEFTNKLETGRWEKAQYLMGNSVQEKLDALKSLTPKGLKLIRKLNNAIAGAGVFEWAQVRDQKVMTAKKRERAKYVKHLKDVIKNFEEHEEDLPSFMNDTAIQRIKDRVAVSRIALERLEAGEAEPVLETIYLDINELNFLPTV